MQHLGIEHLEFLRKVATKPNSIHPLEDISMEDADTMAIEGLLIKYNKPTGPFYAIGRFGAQYAKEHAGPSPEMRELAIKYVKSKGYEEEGVAEEIVDREGVEKILFSQAQELRHGGQRDIQIPTDDKGNTDIKFKKSI